MTPLPALRTGLLAPCVFAFGIVAMPVPAAGATADQPPPVPGGRIGTLELGRYACELPGDASGPVGKPANEFDFNIVNASSYKAGGIRGSYLYVGDLVTMTGGKLKGLKLRLVNEGFLRGTLPDGADGEMRCVLAGHG